MNETKGKLALYWAASCGGCEIAVLGVGEMILDVARAFDIVFWPCVMDHKLRDLEAIEDGGIDVCLFNGSVRTSDQERMARLLRAKSRVLVSFGSCAAEGCIPGLANLHDREEIYETLFHQSPSLEPYTTGTEPRAITIVPQGTLELPEFFDTVRTLDQTVDVDYSLPGCPPESPRVAELLSAIIDGKLPANGSTNGPAIGSETTVCDECSRTRSEKKIGEFKRTWQVIPDPETCLLEQGLLCAGVATRAGCDALCPRVNSPCIGCYGPNDGVEDSGGRLMTALASVIDSDDPEEIERIVTDGIPDPIGTFYRFGLARSLLRRGRRCPVEDPSADPANPPDQEIRR